MERVLLLCADNPAWFYHVDVTFENGMQSSSHVESRPMFPATGYVSRISSRRDPYAEWLLEKFVDSRVNGRFDWRNVQILQTMAEHALSFHDVCSSIVEAIAACGGRTGLTYRDIATHDWIPSFVNDCDSDDYKSVAEVVPKLIMDSALSFCENHRDCGHTPLRVAAASCAGVLRHADVLNRNTYRHGTGIARGTDYSTPTFLNIEFYIMT